jgi:hypothetical protein
MNMGLRAICNYRFSKILILTASAIVFCLAGCATAPMETHQKGMETLTEKEYFIPKKPVDRHFIGCAWSKQFGPLEDPSASDIRIKIDKSFNAIQQNYVYTLALSMGGQSTKAAKVEAGIEAGKAQKTQLEDVQIISPVSLADIPFEPNLPYITEALRLGNFVLKSEAAAKAGVIVTAGSGQGGVKGAMESSGGTSGEGLVVAYRLHMIDPRTYTREDSGSIPLELDKAIDVPKANVFVKTQLRTIDPGSNQSLPRNLLWSCSQANAKSKDMTAAWIIEVRSTDPKRKSLQIAFPAFPKMEDCQNFNAVIYSRIDPLTDKIIRQKVNIIVVEEELSDSLKPKKWEARMSLVEESFNIKLVRQGDLGK